MRESGGQGFRKISGGFRQYFIGSHSHAAEQYSAGIGARRYFDLLGNYQGQPRSGYQKIETHRISYHGCHIQRRMGCYCQQIDDFNRIICIHVWVLIIQLATDRAVFARPGFELYFCAPTLLTIAGL